ncbi:hypothetical protein LSH36_534g02005 [Paralvinella palmiformis]|uniref:CUB domain-containing protein n=1 Tax=Paralvinella palmiformis TaxID=53620 RepID=A0AAD9J8D0_9ANNE|nr:hypothetical protein LSH36_534g02005 [Paralvinella palmiformis]
MDEDCDKSVLLGGATVYSHHGADVLKNYADHIDCRITFRAENDSWKLMLRVDQLDIPDTSYNKVQLCNDALYVYDAKNIFGRAITVLRVDSPAVSQCHGHYLLISGNHCDKIGDK